MLAGLIGLLAGLYIQVRTPEPASTNISQLLTQPEFGTASVEVTGLISTSPRLTRSQSIQFELESFSVRPADTVEEVEKAKKEQNVTGSAYVTVPLLQGTGLHPGQMVTITGSLYQPKPATNPGGFDFRAYLAQQGIFAGVRGKHVISLEKEGRFQQHITPQRRLRSLVQYRLWQVRQRIVRSQVLGLGVPNGPIVSAMLLGKANVDIPYDVRDTFTKAGLAHALAASGFQVSLLIGVILALTQQLGRGLRLCVCTSTLLFYLGLTGLEPSVLRAAVMGFAVLLATTLNRKVNALGALLVAAVLLLLMNPLWIWELAFQLSFLATLGLLITVPVLTKWLDWLPISIATLVAVPVAAYVWTLPLILQIFGVVSPYSILLNTLAAPLITLISLGSAISALVGLIYPVAGGFLASLLHYPTYGFIKMAEIATQLPGNSISTGAIATSQVIALYSLFGLVWFLPHIQRRWWLVGLVCFGLIAFPAWSAYAMRLQVTVLATANQPVMVVQHRGETGLIGSPDDKAATFTVIPFLQQQGINHLNWAIAPNLDHSTTTEGLLKITDAIPLRSLYSITQPTQATPAPTAQQIQPIWHALLAKLQDQQVQPLAVDAATPIQSDAIQAHLLSSNPTALTFQVGNQTWLLLQGDCNSSTSSQLVPQAASLRTDVLWWSGQSPNPDLLAQINPKVAIASANTISAETRAWLQQQKIPIYVTNDNGAIQWTPRKSFVTVLSQDSA